MKKVLMSIKPEFANKIFNGEKYFEFREKLFKDESVTTIVVYASSPFRKVIGEFSIGEILKDTPSNLWERTKEGAGITKEFYDEYFKGKDKAFAIRIDNYHLYDIPCRLDELYPGIKPPRTFCYVED